MLNIDGLEWNIPCEITRQAEMKASDISGMLLNRQYFNDVLGTYMTYEVSIEVPYWMVETYVDLYELLSTPVDGHSFVLPYNDTQISITGRIQVVKDEYVLKFGGSGRWRNTTFKIIANHPSKQMDALEVITTGMTPLPEAPSPEVGDLYEYTAYGWIQRYYANADEIEY